MTYESASTIRWSTLHAPHPMSPAMTADPISPFITQTTTASPAQTSTAQARIPTEPLMNVMGVMVRG